MAHRQQHIPQPNPNLWTSREAYLLAAVCLMAGILLGYLFGGSQQPATLATSGAGAPVSQASAGGETLHSPEALQPLAAPLLAAVQADPKNVDAWTRLGNMYYDAHLYPQAIEYYKKSLELAPNDVNVRTDMGTALWYSGFADQAIAEYEKSLAINPTHPQTLVNMGVVKMQGLGDAKGAIASWEKLLATNPGFSDRARVQAMLAQARQTPVAPSK